MMFNHTTVHMVLVYALGAAERQRACGLITEALATGYLRNAIGARFAIGETALAHVAVETGSIGNVVVTL
jgi:NADPH2:quinone reductase